MRCRCGDMLCYSSMEGVMYAGGSGDAGDDAPCASLCSGGCGRWVLFAGGVSEVVEVQEVMRRVLLCMLEAVDG